MQQALLSFSLVAACLAFCPDAVKAGDSRATQLSYEPWTKICIGDNKNCFVATGARGKCIPSGGGVSINIQDGKRASLSVNLATKHALEGAISAQIDQGNPILILNPSCDEFGCRGKFELDSGFIERLKRAQTITIAAMTTAPQKLRLLFSLADFAQAYDGPGVAPKVFEESQEQLKELLRQRAEKDQPLPQCED